MTYKNGKSVIVMITLFYHRRRKIYEQYKDINGGRFITVN